MQWKVCVGKWNFGDSGGLVVCRVPTQPQRQPALAAITHHALQGRFQHAEPFFKKSCYMIVENVAVSQPAAGEARAERTQFYL